MHVRAIVLMGGFILTLASPASAFNYDSVYQVVPRPSIQTQPKSLTAPNAEASARAYPAQALSARMNGAALISCLVEAGGTPTNCIVSWESPAGYGFGEAALSLAPGFRLEPGTRDGRPITAPVHLPISFDSFPDSPRPPRPPSRLKAPVTFADRGSLIPAPSPLSEIQLLDQRLAAVARYVSGDISFVGLDDQRRSGDVVEISITNVFAYPGESLPVFRVERAEVDCRAQTLARLGERLFDHRGQPDGWRLSDDKAPKSKSADQLTGPVVTAVCEGPSADVTVAGIDAAISVVKSWPNR